MKRFDIYLTNFNPTIGREIKKVRPAVIVSPNDMNDELNTVIVVPMTTKCRNWPSRIALQFGGKNGQVILDQIMRVDKIRLKKKLGSLEGVITTEILKKLREIFT